MFVLVRKEICVYVCVSVCLFICLFVCLLACYFFLCVCVRDGECFVCVRECLRECVLACERACVRECVHACVRECVHACVRVSNVLMSSCSIACLRMFV